MKTLFSHEQIQKRIREMGAEISADFKKRKVTEPIVLGILKGSFMFMADLVRVIDVKQMECEFLGVSSYGNETTSSGEVKVTHDLSRPVHGRDILLVEDIVDTGLTISFLQKTLLGRGARSLTTAVFLSKPSQLKVKCKVDHVGFEVGNEFVVGYGLDASGLHRNLPFVGVMS